MKKIKISDILEVVKTINFIGNRDLDIFQLIDFQNDLPDSPHQLFWSNEKNAYKLNGLHAGTAIVSEATFINLKNDKLNFIIVDKPRLAFKQILDTFFVSKEKPAFICASAKIDQSVKYNNSVYIGENVVIEENCEIGENTFIGNNTVIHANTIIKNNVKIGCNNTIGCIGFGYEKNEDGQWEAIPHIGNVIIHDNVEIGNNNCIDRAVLGSTLISKNVKIDNLVHIAHGVKIGENSLIIANAMIGGSTIIGENVWVGPSASVINKGVVKNNGFIGMSAVVVKPVEENTIVAGNPAKYLRDNIQK